MHATLQKLASADDSVTTRFDQEHNLSGPGVDKSHRAAGLSEWRKLLAA